MSKQDRTEFEPIGGIEPSETTVPTQQTSLDAFRPPRQRLATSGHQCELCLEEAPPDDSEKRRVVTAEGIADPGFKISLCSQCASVHDGPVMLK